jgi:hypothetical protein
MMAIPLKRFQWFFAGCLLIKLFFVVTGFLQSLLHPLDDAAVSAILLNYNHGFQRRSLAGTIFLFFSRNGPFLLFCIKAVFLFCIGLLFILLLKPLMRNRIPVVILLLLLFVDSPFGFAFYKNWWFSKEFLFFPLIGLFLIGFLLKNDFCRLLLFNGIVIAGLLVHETFVFLVLPFLLSYSALRGEKTKILLTLLLTACAMLLILKLFPVSPGPAIRAYIADARQMGLSVSDQFVAPLDYMQMGLSTLFRLGFRSFLEPVNWIYFLLYLIQSGLLYQLYRLFDRQMIIAQKRSLLPALLFIHLAACPLYLLAWDYGRWASFTFIISFLLIVRQINLFPSDFSAPKNPLQYKICLICLASFFLLIRVPLYTVSAENSLLNYLKEFTVYTKLIHFLQ